MESSRQASKKSRCRFACPVSRRGFLAGCAAFGAGVLGMAAFGSSGEGAGTQGKPKIRLVFLHPSSEGPIWPNIGYDFDGRKEELMKGFRNACPDIDFLPVTIRDSEDAQKVLKGDQEVEGYLVYILGCTWSHASKVFTSSGKPVLLVDDLFAGSGEFLIDNAAAMRAGHKSGWVSSSRFEDVAAAARCFEVLKQPGRGVEDFLAECRVVRKKSTKPAGLMACRKDEVPSIDMEECRERLQSSKILVVGGNAGQTGKAIEDVFGTRVVNLDFKGLQDAYLKADRKEAAEWADRWVHEAEKVMEPSRTDIEDSGTLYLAIRALMKEHTAEAIAINCLGGFYGGHLQAYPCLGFCQLNNDGSVGACEADLQSTITMLAMGYLTGRPGFISDPVIDASKNQIVYAHCVAPYKVFGPKGPANPFHIRSHSEDRKGACIRSLMPLGWMITTLKINPVGRQVILHQGISKENIDEDKACRTKLAVEVKGNIEKLMEYWDQWGWHRVTFYGDLRKPVQQMCEAYGLQLIEEA